MILVDADVWIAHIDAGEPELAKMPLRREAPIHPYAIGEIALGHPPAREAVLAELRLLPGIIVAHHEEVMRMIETRRIRGIGYVDGRLLASALLAPGVRLWTRDERSCRMAERLPILAPLA